MYAVIQTGGKQYKVEEGNTLKIEKIDIEADKKVTFNEVLMIADGDNIKIGTPLLLETSVEAKVISHSKDKKINIIKFLRRKNSMKKQGHRQSFTKIKINKIKS
jgi:large subunit ribosomal protein L21